MQTQNRTDCTSSQIKGSTFPLEKQALTFADIQDQFAHGSCLTPLIAEAAEWLNRLETTCHDPVDTSLPLEDLCRNIRFAADLAHTWTLDTIKLYQKSVNTQARSKETQLQLAYDAWKRALVHELVYRIAARKITRLQHMLFTGESVE